ncbi:MAG: hypothetical protein B7Z82_06035 [Halothiobacillus sp. 20-54-6]|nr:MAG: hypothetical protein B7Z82_06035 [Halothiobacillus sp. 20-54-6]
MPATQLSGFGVPFYSFFSATTTDALAEGSTLIALVFVAVPLKYWAGLPIAVKIMGPIHGACFTWAMLVLITAVVQKHLSIGRAAQVFIAALIPFGGLWSHRLIDREIAKKI